MSGFLERLAIGPTGWGDEILAGTWLTIRLALATLPIALHREKPAQAAASGAAPVGVGAWIDMARRPKMLTWLVILALYKGGEALAYQMVKPLLVDRGVSTEDIAELIGGAGFTAGFLGAVDLPPVARSTQFSGCARLATKRSPLCLNPFAVEISPVRHQATTTTAIPARIPRAPATIAWSPSGATIRSVWRWLPVWSKAKPCRWRSVPRTFA